MGNSYGSNGLFNDYTWWDFKCDLCGHSVRLQGTFCKEICNPWSEAGFDFVYIGKYISHKIVYCLKHNDVEINSYVENFKKTNKVIEGKKE